MAYLLNTWYVAGWADELAPGALVSRRLLDIPVVMFRDAQGKPHALHDRCPHRFLPLSAGKLNAETGTVQCGYHGLEFDGTGRCTLNPHGDNTIPKAAKVRSYPLLDRNSTLWIWMGDPERADPALLPDFSCMDPDIWYVGKGYLRPRADYRLEVDNILDLSHIEFVHSTLLGSEAVKRAKTEVRQEGASIWSCRLMQDEVLPDAGCDQFGVPRGMHIDRWLDVRWDAPGNMLLLGGACPTGQSRENTVGVVFTNPHLFTPETATTTHYWFSMCMRKSAGPHGEQAVQEIIKVFSDTFDKEDTPVIERQQLAMGDADFWDLKPVLLSSDAAGVRVRRHLDGLIAAEQAELARTTR